MYDDRASFGFSCWSDPASVMSTAHQHNDIEFNFADVDLAYLIGGERVIVTAGRVAAFWGATPHQLIESEHEAPVTWLTVPLDRFLRWRVAAAASRRLLAGQPLLAPEEWSRAQAPHRLAQWRHDLAADAPAGAAELAELEAEAFAARFALVAEVPGVGVHRVGMHSVGAGGVDAERPRAGSGVDQGFSDPSVRRAAAMASFIADHFAEPLRIADIADSVHLHPNYASAVFARMFGVSPGAYLQKFRIGEAQRMLLRSSTPIAEVALACGFTSASAFYDAFTGACGMPPGQWRRAHAGAGPG